MNECTLYSGSHITALNALGWQRKFISHLNLLKRNSTTTGSAQLCSCPSNFPRGSLLQSFCSRPDSPLTTMPLLHTPMVSTTQDAFLPHPSRSDPLHQVSLILQDHSYLHRFLPLCKEHRDHLSWFLIGPEMCLADLHGLSNCDHGWTNHLTSLCLSLLICKMEVINSPRWLQGLHESIYVEHLDHRCLAHCKHVTTVIITGQVCPPVLQGFDKGLKIVNVATVWWVNKNVFYSYSLLLHRQTDMVPIF